ncbi:hypothetical protein [Myroides injenensis]|uniref:hypothetical protein n=1 Tax=Myroides injenensis TaxID=1183151 RepID=UPI00028841E6|nr:hypothetical protein [Myroides injenensis]
MKYIKNKTLIKRKASISISMIIFFIFIGIYNSKAQERIGINKALPEATLDINGDLIIREIPVIQHGDEFYSIGHDKKHKIVSKSKDVTSFSTYLGFSPDAKIHTAVLPINLEDNYIITISGFSVGACYGVLTEFTITFIGKNFSYASLQSYATAKEVTKTYSKVTLNSNNNIFNTPLEILSKGSECESTSGHTLRYNKNTNEITVSFLDRPVYFKNAGVFVINNISKVKLF